MQVYDSSCTVHVCICACMYVCMHVHSNVNIIDMTYVYNYARVPFFPTHPKQLTFNFALSDGKQLHVF